MPQQATEPMSEQTTPMLRSTGVPVPRRVAARTGAVTLPEGTARPSSPLDPPAAWRGATRLPGATATPRLLVGRTVLQRATWWFPLEELHALGRGSPARRYLEAVAFARRHGLPRRTLVRVPGEPKPVHLDLANPLLVDAVVRLLARASGREGAAECRVTEMLPAPDGSAVSAERHAQEFRLSCVRVRPAPAGA